MPTLTIDDQQIEVMKGTKVIEAAERLGIMIPRFCYYKPLGSVGACRMCAVKLLHKESKGVQMSCMLDAEDGMIVSTTHPEAVEFRRHVIEWLMLNHPHDCPVCDEGGHCLLQDLTVAGGHGIRRYKGKKRTYRDQDLGIFIQHEMNRCIQCYRCSRFYQEFCGYRDLGVMQIGDRVYFGRFKEGALESPFAGNLADLCPTGVYTDKPSRYKGRRWDYERSPSLCIHCSLGCHTVASARYREMVRLEARYSREVNGYFICDRGRYGFHYNEHPQRPRRAKIDQEEAPWDQAVEAAVEKMARMQTPDGTSMVAAHGSVRTGLETQAMLARLCRRLQWRGPGYFAYPLQEQKVRAAVSRLDERLLVSLREIEGADLVVCVGADPVNEAPMLALALRQAYRKGASVIVIDPRAVFLPLGYEHVPARLADVDRHLHALLKGLVDRKDVEKMGTGALAFYDAASEAELDSKTRDRLASLQTKLQKSRKPVIVCGTEIVPATTPVAAADWALILRSAKGQGGLFYLLPGANAFGGALLAAPGRSFAEVVEEIEQETLRALVLVEADPFRFFPDRERLSKALKKLDLLLVLDYLPSEIARHAHIFLPTRSLYEAGGTFVNQEGRVQYAPRAYRGGLSIVRTGGGDHPPREFRGDIPGNEPRAAWQALAELEAGLAGGQPVSLDGLWQETAEENAVLGRMLDRQGGGAAVRLVPEESAAKPFVHSLEAGDRTRSKARWDLLLVDRTFGTEELSAYSEYVRAVSAPPRLSINAQDAADLGLTTGSRVFLDLDRGPLEIKLQLEEQMARETLVLPRHEQIFWQQLKTIPARVDRKALKKA
jgi:NADH-quinone oxidoreductase subunit G